MFKAISFARQCYNSIIVKFNFNILLQSIRSTMEMKKGFGQPIKRNEYAM